MSFERVTPQEAQKLVEDEGYQHLDVRTVEEFVDGHPKGAFNIPFITKDPATGQRRPNTRFLEEVQANFPVDTKLLLSCAAGGRSARAAQMLIEAGFQNVIDNRAGWGGEKDMAGRVVTPGWEEAELPYEEGDGGERSYASLTKG